MRLLKLGLLAYGPFTDEHLDFATDEPTLHMVFGPNEAGKSTALRAIVSMLYGIPTRTGDAHMHRAKELRIRGEIAYAEQQSLAFVRRKGSKGTLLDTDGGVMDEALLQRALSGVSRQLFTTMFGLDHNTLRAGAHALLQGGGEVGESLFDAGGARGVHKVLEQLRGEADELFKARGKNQKLPQALRELKEAKEAIVLAETAPEGFVAQEQALVERKQERDLLVAQRQQLVSERHALERMRTVLPHLAQMRELRARTDTIKNAPPWLIETRAEREQAAAELQLATRDVERLTEELARVTAQAAKLQVNEALLNLAPSRKTAVQDALGNHRQAAQHLPKRRGQLAALQEDTTVILGQLGHDTPLEKVDTLRPTAAAEARIDVLTMTHPKCVAERQAAERALKVANERATTLQRQLDALPEPPPLAALHAAWRRAERAGDLPARIQQTQQQCEQRQAQFAVQRAALGDAAKDVAATVLRSWSPPTSEAVNDFEQQRVALQHRGERLQELKQELALDQEQTQVALDALRLAGVLPTVEQLGELRRGRDTLFAALLDDQSTEAAVNGYLAAVKGADDVADQLWQQADRVAQANRRAAEQAGHARTQTRLDEDAAQLDEQRAQWSSRWQALWQSLPVDVETPQQMLGWLERFQLVLQTMAALGEAEQQRDTLVVEREQYREQLVSAWQQIDAQARIPDSFHQLLDAVADVHRQLNERADERGHCVRTLKQLEHEKAELSVDRERSESAWTRWQSDWAEQMNALGLAANATIHETATVRARLRDLFDKVKDARAMQQRIDGMERDAEVFEQLVASLAAEMLPSVQQLPTVDAADRLLSEVQAASRSHAERSRLNEEAADKRTQLQDAGQRQGVAEATLQTLFTRAAVTSLAELVQLEEQANERKRLSDQLTGVERALLEAGDGRTLAELEQLASSHDVDQASARLQTVEEELNDINERVDRVNVDIGNTQYSLEEHFHKRRGAFAAALDKQNSIAKIRRHAEQYARLRLATLILEQEIERYRERNQGPIIRRASELFNTLTLGRYAELRVDYAGGDHPELRCRPSAGGDIAIDGLSDGTRDQLYLALRLASLERYARRAEVMPLVLDDILVHFDDERARAALKVVSQMTPTTQVLFFTHHQRLLELARAVVPQGGLREHHLSVKPRG